MSDGVTAQCHHQLCTQIQTNTINRKAAAGCNCVSDRWRKIDAKVYTISRTLSLFKFVQVYAEAIGRLMIDKIAV